jgi:hypothetical protein
LTVFFLRFLLQIIPQKSFRNIRPAGLLFKGKGAYGFLTGCQVQALRVLQKISTPAQAPGSIFRKKPDSPKPYTVIALKQ